MNLSCSLAMHENSSSSFHNSISSVSELSHFPTHESYISYLKNNAINQLNSESTLKSTFAKTVQVNSDESPSNFALMSPTNGHDLLQTSRQTLPPCATSMAGLPRFPTPTNLDDNRPQLSLSAPRLLRTNPVSRRTRHFVPNDRKDEYYWQKRKKNNEAARKSREKRRTIDSVLEEKVMVLSHENKSLKDELRALKMKYGEITNENNRGSHEPGNDHDKILFNRNEARLNGDAPHPVSEAPPDRAPVLPSDPNLSPTAISFPRLNVVLESPKSDPKSSAKLVLSNLASGTLILSPINGESDTKRMSHFMHSYHDVAHSQASLQYLSNSIENAKALEAAHALAKLLHSNGTNGTSDVASVRRISATSTSRSSSLDDETPNHIEGKKFQNLPHKLRFKMANRDFVEA